MTEERQKAIWAIYGKNVFRNLLIHKLDIGFQQNIRKYSSLIITNMCIRKSFFSVWCRRTDELVDGPNAGYMSPAVLDRWEERLQDIFYGRPYDMHDAALADTVFKFPLDIKVHICLPSNPSELEIDFLVHCL